MDLRCEGFQLLPDLLLVLEGFPLPLVQEGGREAYHLGRQPKHAPAPWLTNGNIYGCRWKFNDKTATAVCNRMTA